MGSRMTLISQNSNLFPPGQIIKNGILLGLSTAFFVTSEIIALTSFLRPPSWRLSTIYETCQSIARFLGAITIPAMICGIILLAWATRVAPKQRFPQLSIYVLAIALGYATILISVSLFFEFMSGSKGGMTIFSLPFSFFITALEDGLFLSPLAVFPVLIAARASDKWSQCTGTTIWRLRIIKVMNIGWAFLIGASFVFVAVNQFRRQ